MVLFLDFRRKPLLLLFFDPTALGGYISEDEEKAEAEAEAEEEDIEIDYSRLSEGCEEEKSLLVLVFFFLFSWCVDKQTVDFFRERRQKAKKREKEKKTKKREDSFEKKKNQKKEKQVLFSPKHTQKQEFYINSILYN
tara:strand:+ start:91 stop:504 length:414 start_codon:yes stop_codon:yes gene_type:complete